MDYLPLQGPAITQLTLSGHVDPRDPPPGKNEIAEEMTKNDAVVAAVIEAAIERTGIVTGLAIDTETETGTGVAIQSPVIVATGETAETDTETGTATETLIVVGREAMKMIWTDGIQRERNPESSTTRPHLQAHCLHYPKIVLVVEIARPTCETEGEMAETVIGV
jgi:hypothetical protein